MLLHTPNVKNTNLFNFLINRYDNKIEDEYDISNIQSPPHVNIKKINTILHNIFDNKLYSNTEYLVNSLIFDGFDDININNVDNTNDIYTHEFMTIRTNDISDNLLSLIHI